MTPTSWIRGLATCAHPLSAPISDKVFVMLVAYMDESGTHDGSHNCVVAGYWGGVKEWTRFEYSWRRALNGEDIEKFHANEFWPRIDGERIGPYKGWSDERHRGFIDKLLAVIEASNITPFAAGVLGGEWNKQPPRYHRVFTGMNDEQLAKPGPKSLFLPFQVCVVRASGYCKPGKRMNFVSLLSG